MARKARSTEKLEKVEFPSPEVLLQEGWGITAPLAIWEETGVTGKAQARVQTAAGPLYLRRYPKSISASWLAAVHEAVAYLERRGFALFPRFIPNEMGETLLHHGRYWYDLAEWATGAVLLAAQLSEEQLGNLGEAIAHLHQAGEGAPGPAVRFDWLSGRSAETLHLAWDPVARGKDAWQEPANLTAFFDPLITNEQVAAHPEVRNVVATAAETLRWLGPDAGIRVLASAPPTLTHGDLWPDHVRFEGPSVVALLDLDTLALRPPGGDLAALLADFALWQPERYAAVLAGYRRRLPVSEETVAALPRLAALRTLGVLRARLRSWLAHPEAPLAGPIPYWLEQLQLIQASRGMVG
ncbi:MAG TPA: phosphotransferase [Chloroflexota bacterium]|nr:phosphotransferase [Chloroflexota bacterium]